MTCNQDDELNPIVLDNGSGNIQIGFAGEDAPTVLFPNIIGHARDNSLKESFIGDNALGYTNLLNLRYPMEHGIVTNWDDMETIWRYALHQELGLTSLDRPILITETPINPLANQEKMIQVIFESFQAPAMYVANPGILSIYASGRGTAISLNIGDGVAHTVTCFEGHSIQNAENRVDFAGRDLTDYLARLLAERGYSFTTTTEREIVRDMKQKLAYVALNIEEELLKSNGSKKDEVIYELPDGQKISIGNERFRCMEALFQSKLVDIDEPSVLNLLCDTIKKCDIDTIKTFRYNIVLSGGTTLVPGLKERLKKELSVQLSTDMLNIISPPERRYSTWIGGSILASLSTFQQMWITKQMYDESGPSIVYRNRSRSTTYPFS